MDQITLEATVKKLASRSEGSEGVVRFLYDDITMYLISDDHHNRMRLVAPIAEYDKLERYEIDAMMESNFQSALDARYATSDGILYAAYIHPLNELTQLQIREGLSQVASLTSTFGSDYSSSAISFGSLKSFHQPSHDSRKKMH
ncbi:Uncharacterised protein [BD1-7 clade bacterium]|uniref:Uncharacterized protein n=1 Tax=BD1-7 clade bacterium TaxID=2029982 RepID=A0A5S9MYT2_9GAMM|nr:Uncharacterised protein [BD1-7 clade bacterium]